MNRNLILTLCCCFIFATTLVVVLYASTRTILHERNNFIREYAKLAAVKASEFNLGLNSYYIAGIANEHIYLGNITAPFRMVVANLTLTDTQHVKLNIRGIDSPLVYKHSFVRIDSPYFYLADGERPTLYRGKVGEWVAESFLPQDTYFTQLVPISKSAFAIRTNLTSTLDNVLGKLQSDSPYISLKPQLIKRQIDGVFCTDGTLDYNNDFGRAIYTYHYRNEFIVCDTNLNLKYKGHTIDTFKTAQIKVGHINSSNRRVLTYRRYVNKGSATSGINLFINSNVLAKNDTKNALSRTSIIDVYHLLDGTYRFSFIIRNHDDTQIREFQVLKNKVLFSLAGNRISRYDLHTPFFSP